MELSEKSTKELSNCITNNIFNFYNLNKDKIKIAFLNVHTAFVTDCKNNLEKYPKYQWSKRLKPMLELIKIETPDILGLVEFNLVQAKDFQTLFQNDYELYAFSSETKETFEIIDNKISQGQNIIYGEFVGFLMKKKTIQLINLKCHELPRGERHGRILVEANLNFINTNTEFTFLVSHFDHLSLTSRKKSGDYEIDLINKYTKPYISMGDRNS